jgi:hypothetical protein
LLVSELPIFSEKVLLGGELNGWGIGDFYFTANQEILWKVTKTSIRIK